MDYTTVELLKNTKRRGFIPTGSGLTSSELLQVLSEQLRNYIPAFLKGLREEFIIAELSIPVTSSAVPVPPRACGAALRTIGWLRGDGSPRPLIRIEPERRSAWAPTDSEPQGFMFRGNNAVLVPSVTGGTLVVTYQQRPGQLVLPTSCAVVVSLDDSSTFLVDSVPSGISAGVLCDVVSAAPNFKMLAMDLEVSSVTPGRIEFTSAVPTDWAAGDYVCLAGETPIPQVPPEVHDLLAQAAAFQIASDTGSSRLPSITAALKELREQVSMILSPRADGSSRPIVNRSRLGRWGW